MAGGAEPPCKSRSEIGSAAWSFLRVETASDGRVCGEELELQSECEAEVCIY